MLRFAQLQMRLIAKLRDKVSSGEVTERGLARVTGVSQPHLHNVLKGKKFLSQEMSDRILDELHLDLLDLVDPAELSGKLRRPLP